MATIDEVRRVARFYAHIIRSDHTIDLGFYEALTRREGATVGGVRLWLDDMFGVRVIIASRADDVDGVDSIEVPL